MMKIQLCNFSPDVTIKEGKGTIKEGKGRGYGEEKGTPDLILT